MDTSVFIDTVMSAYEQISSSDGDNTARRARLLQFTQEAFDETWTSDDYVYTYATGTVTVSAGSDIGDLPADFMEFGSVGGIWDNATLEQMGELRPVAAYGGVIGGSQGDNQGLVSLYGINTSTGRRTIRLPGLAGSTVTLKILYRTLPATLVDTTGLTGNLWRIPAAYHNTVLLPLVVSKTAKSKGDARDYRAEVERGLRTMRINERQRKTTTQYMPLAMRNW